MKHTPAWLTWFLALMAMAIVLRAGLAFTYAPAHTTDTEGYLYIARLMHDLNLRGNNAARPPVYPGLIALVQLNENAVWAVQSILGISVSALLYLVTWRLTHRAWLAFLAGALHSVNLAQLYFEGMILAETVTTFLFVLSLALLVLRFRVRERWPRTELVLGLLAAALALTRPQMLFLSGALVPLVWVRRRAEPVRTKLAAEGLLVSPVVVFVLVWSLINLRTAGYFGLTSLSGYGLTDMVGNYMEYAPDKYAVVRDIYVEHRDARVAVRGNYAQTVWAAFWDMSEATGLDYSGLSRLLGQVSIDLIRAHPALYLKNVALGWVGFWKVPNYWRLNLVHPTSLVPLLEKVWQVERAGLLGLNGVFLGMGGVWMIRWVRRSLYGLEATLLATWMVVIVGSVAQALVQYGENPRYGVPFEPLMVWTVVMGLWSVARHSSLVEPSPG